MKKLLRFPPIPPGRSITQPHGLNDAPDLVIVGGRHARHFLAVCDTETVTVRNGMRVARRVEILVERFDMKRFGR